MPPTSVINHTTIMCGPLRFHEWERHPVRFPAADARTVAVICGCTKRNCVLHGPFYAGRTLEVDLGARIVNWCSKIM
jgi:hypothetical protein